MIYLLNSPHGDLLLAELSIRLTVCNLTPYRITCDVIKFYNGVNKLAECSIRVTVLLEYLDLAFATRSWL